MLGQIPELIRFIFEKSLKQEVIPYLNQKQRDRVQYIESEITRLRKLKERRNRTSYEVAKDGYEMEELQSELDGLIAAECPLTG